MQRENTNSASARPKRKPVGAANRLKPTKLDQDKFSYRWVNDDADRVAMFKDAGYEIVSAGEAGLEKARIEGGAGADGTISVGNGTKAVLMRQPKEFYTEDQQAKQKRVDETMRAIEKPDLDGQYGSINIRS